MIYDQSPIDPKWTKQFEDRRTSDHTNIENTKSLAKPIIKELESFGANNRPEGLINKIKENRENTLNTDPVHNDIHTYKNDVINKKKVPHGQSFIHNESSNATPSNMSNNQTVSTHDHDDIKQLPKEGINKNNIPNVPKSPGVSPKQASNNQQKPYPITNKTTNGVTNSKEDFMEQIKPNENDETKKKNWLFSRFDAQSSSLWSK